MIEFSILGSGSKGNSTFVKINGYSFLIDCGLSCKQIELRLRDLGVEPSSIDGIFLSHEHEDHIKSIHTFSRRYNVPVITTEKTYKAGRLKEKKVENVMLAKSGGVFTQFKGVDVFFCPLPHDAADPNGFIFYSEGIKFSHITDLGYPTELVSHEIENSHAIVVESNHDPNLLKLSSYPWELKQRIASRRGHLSNGDCCRLLEKAVGNETKYVILAHLSEENNNPDIALMHAHRVLKDTGIGIDIAVQKQATPIFSIEKADVKL